MDQHVPCGRACLHLPCSAFRILQAAAKAVSVVTPNAVPDVTPNSGKASESRKRGRPRVLSDEQRREKVRQRVSGWRAARRTKAEVRS